jgi:hypothetical protein
MFPAGTTDSFFSKVANLALGPAQHPKKWVTGDLSPGVKRPERGADRSNAKFRNERSNTSTPPYTFMMGTKAIFL